MIPGSVGYIIQRPESHNVHHARGLHAFNYADLPVFDWLFGTLRNPKDAQTELGFFDGASKKIGQLLLAFNVELAATSPGN